MPKQKTQKETQLSYQEALTELQSIVIEIENEEIGIDELAMKTKRASFLIQFCQQKLRSTESEINEYLQEK